MGDDNKSRRAAAICENCGTAHSVRIGPEGDVRPIGTGQGPQCSCDDGDLHVLSDDADILADVDSEDQRRTE